MFRKEGSMSFTYKNISTDSLLDVPLRIGVTEGIEKYEGFSREIMKGESSISRPIPNEHGTTYDNLPVLNIVLWKSDTTIFTREEQRTVNKWLTSPKLSDYVVFNPCNEFNSVTYKGLFTDVSWDPAMRMCFVTFTSNSPYTWKHDILSDSITGSKLINISCHSDELEEYVYPFLILKKTDVTGNVTITNITDQNNILCVRLLEEIETCIDCRFNMVYDKKNKGLITFKDLGWEDAGNIYWPRLLPGNNTWHIEGSVDITIDFYSPQKVLGGYIW